MLTLNKFKIFFLIPITGFMASCAMGPGFLDRAYSARDIQIPAQNMGVVFGKRCEGGYIVIKNKQTGNKIAFSGVPLKKTSSFALQLPPGDYEIDGLSAGGHPTYISRSPFTFTVEANTVKYVGTLIKSWSIYNKTPKEYDCSKDASYIYAKKMYRSGHDTLTSIVSLGLHAYLVNVNPDKSAVYAANYPEGILNEMAVEYPKLKLDNYQINLMR